MKKVTDFLGKPVLSIYESTTEGIIKDLIFDKNFKKLKYIVLFSDSEFLDERIVAMNDIYSNGEHALTIKNDSFLNIKSDLTDELNSPINNLVYTTQGKYIGTVKDVIIDDKNFIKSILLTDDTKIDIEKVVTSGKDAMFIQDENKEVKLCNFKKRPVLNNKTNKNIKVEILKEDEAETDNIKTEEILNSPIVSTNNINNDDNKTNEEKNEEVKDISIKPKKKVILKENNLPKISVAKDNFLIGRKVEKNIYSFNNELIIKRNTKVTEKTIIIAKSHSKLKELSLYSK